MSCCGNERQAWLQDEHARMTQNRPATTGGPVEKPVYFQYNGPSALTVLGPISGQRYRFANPGALLNVDARDAGYLMAVPHLKRVRAG